MYAEDLMTVEGIVFSLPERVKITSNAPVNDYTLVYFLLDDTNIFLRAYIGNFPQEIYRDKSEFEIKEQIISNNRGKYWYQKNTNTNCGEALIQLNTTQWPNYIQFWYTDVDNQTTDLIEKIISNLHYGKP
jgi:phage antirepressor YoqD-like protein